MYAWVIATPGLRDRNGNLKGTDFLHFYTLGSLAIEHRGEALYDMNAQASLAARVVPAATGVRYLPLYPPQVSMFFAPFAYFPFPRALASWWAISALIYAACCYSIWRVCPNLSGYAGTVALLAAAFPGFFNLIAWGQTSALALACFTIAFLCFRNQKEFMAGISLGLLIFKPQLALAAAIFFLSLGAWRVIAGAVVSAAAEISAGVLYYGGHPLLTWLRTLWQVPEMVHALEPRPYQTHSLRTFWSMLIPWSSIAFVLYIISAIVVLVWAIQVWKRSQSRGLCFSFLLLATVLVAPHLTVYDLVILVPAFLLLADWLLGQGKTRTANIGVLLYLVYMLPLVGFLSRWTHVQLSVLAMTALAYQIRNFVRSADFPHNAVSAGARLAQV
jgi:Glycosyltransferase family 87